MLDRLVKPIPTADLSPSDRPSLRAGSTSDTLVVKHELEMVELRRELAEWKTLGRRLSSIFERAPVGIFIKNFDGVYLHANPTAASVLQRGLDQLIGSSDEELFGSAAAQEIRDIDQYVVTTSRPFRYEARRMTSGGERVFQTTKWPMNDEEGGTSAIIGMSRDITDQKYAEEYYRLQSSVSATLQASIGVDEALRTLLLRVREVFSADIAFLWSSDEGASKFEVVTHALDRPGFGAKLIEHSASEGPGQTPELDSCTVASIDPHTPRQELAEEAGLKLRMTLPIRHGTGASVIEILDSELRSPSEPLLQNLEEARRRINQFARLLARE